MSSPFIAVVLERQGLLAGELAQAAASDCAEPAGLSCESRLRRARNREWARLALRAFAGLDSLDETLKALSGFADCACTAALAAAQLSLLERHGSPRDGNGQESRLIVLGMGKLGGGELNASSDIDLILAYTAAGETDGPRPLSNGEYFAKLAQAFVKLLSERTEDGFVFRVDLMLRPFGSAGPVAISVDAMENYYQAHGRDWERYALIKARPVAGDLAAGAALLERLRPFVYRRYLDFDALAGLRELKRKIAADAASRGMAEDDLKLGVGGIRECEFIVQSFQLVRGGPDARLRGPAWAPMLAQLVALGHLPAEDGERLRVAYSLLRRAENAVQWWADEQTHALPQEPARRSWLAAVLGYADAPAFETALVSARTAVAELFARVFAEPDTLPASAAAVAATSAWQDERALQESTASLTAAGFAAEPGARVASALIALRESARLRAASANARQRLDALIPLLAMEAASQPEGASALIRALEVLAAVLGRTTYLTLLRESPTARGNLLTLCAASPWIAESLSRHPVLLDQLLDARRLYAPPDRAALRADLLPRMAALALGDTESEMDLLRRAVRENTLRIAAADAVHALPLPQVSDRLTWLAEAAIEAALTQAQRELLARHGAPLRADGQPAGIAVIGYGKLGALEMGYGSDLDLVFVHDADPPDADSAAPAGARALPNASWMIRCAQKVVSLLATRTHLDRAYEVDLALRPNGASGQPATTLAAWRDYQLDKAWSWEHQALSRARYVAGDAALGAAFERIRVEVLCRPRDADKLCEEILAMRAKMRAHLDKPAAGRWNVKQGEGGLVDVEFIVQYAVLRHAHRHPAVVEYPDVWRQLDALVAAGVLATVSRDALLAAQRAYRAYLHRQLLRGEPADAPADDFSAERAAVTATWREQLSAAG